MIYTLNTKHEIQNKKIHHQATFIVVDLFLLCFWVLLFEIKIIQKLHTNFRQKTLKEDLLK